MYTTNLIIAHNVTEKAQLRSCLDRVCSVHNCGILHDAKEALLELYFVHPQADDLCFELFDLSDTDSSGLFLSSNYPPLPTELRGELYLNHCFGILREVVEAALSFCSVVEIFITRYRASMEDFSTHAVEINQLTELLHRLFRESLNTDGIDPEIHLFVPCAAIKQSG